MHFKIVFGTNAHIGSDTLYTKLSLVCCSIIILLDLSYLYKIFFELSKPRKIRHEFLNQKILNFWRGVGGGGGNNFWNFPVLFHLLWMCCFVTSVKHDCMLHTNSFRLFEHYHSLYNVIIFKLHQSSFTQLISVRKVQIVMFVLWMNNTYFDFFQDKVRRSLWDSNTILHGPGTSYWRRTVWQVSVGVVK